MLCGGDCVNNDNFDFIDTTAKDNEIAAVNKYAELTGIQLVEADPRRIILKSVSYMMALAQEVMNDTAKQNFLRFARNNRLDAKGELYGNRGKRLESEPARTTLQFEISAAQAGEIAIPKGTKVTVNKLIFKTEEEGRIKKGTVSADVQAVCTESGEIGNGFLPGQIDKIVDVFPYYKSVKNITESKGGTTVESDEQYRERLMVVPESFSVAGPAGAYEFWAKSTSPLITNVKAISPNPGCVDVYIWTKYGEPTIELLHQVQDKVNDNEVRPLTDLVQVKVPEKVYYSVEMEYFIEKENELHADEIEKNVKTTVSEWADWQQEKLGRDINTDELIYRLKKIGVKRMNILSPEFKKIEEHEIAILEGEVNIINKGTEV